jgi:ribosomal protein L37E
MADVRRKFRAVPFILVALVLWGSSARGIPADPPAGEGEEAVSGDPWAGVRVSDAYEYIKCPRCGKENDLRATRCSRCEYEFPQPSAEVTDPYLVFVPGRGYYNEGEIIEPGHTRWWLWVPGLVITYVGAGEVLLGSDFLSEGTPREDKAIIISGCVIFIGGLLMTIVGLSRKTKPIYAFHAGELYEPHDGVACERGPVDSGNPEFNIEVPVLGF